MRECAILPVEGELNKDVLEKYFKSEVIYLALTEIECPRQDSNLCTCLRRAVLYPLSYGGLYYYKPHRHLTGDRLTDYEHI